MSEAVSVETVPYAGEAHQYVVDTYSKLHGEQMYAKAARKRKRVVVCAVVLSMATFIIVTVIIVTISSSPSSVELPLVEIPEWPQRKVVHRETPSGTTSRVLKILFTNETQNEISNPNIQAQAIYSTMNY
ncbi:uncharacterized protein LOC111249568 [Varroa destructor]|uniref:Uncharacterized protein n=1 Tax=Varroa destructor TaxID=109461 RepID=A0A7M7JZY8_VARDE|nr:uncharacterized protein LOC111249568 [Varroa destructor]